MFAKGLVVRIRLHDHIWLGARAPLMIAFTSISRFHLRVGRHKPGRRREHTQMDALLCGLHLDSIDALLCGLLKG